MNREVEFEQTDELILRMLRSRNGAKIFLKQLFFIGLVAAAIAMVLGGSLRGLVRGGAVFAVLLAILWYAKYRQTRKQAKTLLAKMPHRRVRWNFTEDHARVEGPLGTTEFTWQMLEAVWRLSDHWQLVFLANAHAIPTEVVDAELGEFFIDAARAVGAKVCRESFLGIYPDRTMNKR